jgi:hypothetical protein
LIAKITARALRFTPARVWNPSPSIRHRTSPYDVPKSLRIGVLDNEDTSAKYSPPPFAVVVEGDDKKTLVVVAADTGWHRWNNIDFKVTATKVTVAIDLEGRTRSGDMLRYVSVNLVRAERDESRHELLARGLKQLYPAASARPPRVSDWCLRPIYCGWGDQVTTAMRLEGVGPEPRALAYCLQGLYERWIRRLDEAQVPFGTVTIDAGWSPAGVWEPDAVKWPDLRGFVDRQHRAGRRVLLWLGAWQWDGLPEPWCIKQGSRRLTTDPTHPEYRAFIREKVRMLLSPDGYDADGFKIDQLAWAPSHRRSFTGPRYGKMEEKPASDEPIQMHDDLWGCELLHLLQKDIYDAAKNAKPDALITSSTVHPYFHDTFDMVRIHDMGYLADDIFTAMRARVDLAKAALPGKPIDTDDWVHSDYAMWLRYTSGSHVLGVPCIFYTEHFMNNWKKEPATIPIPLEDLRKIGRSWKEYLASLQKCDTMVAKPSRYAKR